SSTSRRACGTLRMLEVMTGPRGSEKRGAAKARRSPGSSGALFAHVVDVLNHVHGVLIVLVGHRHKLLVLAVGQAVEGGLVLGGSLHESLYDALLEISWEIGEVRIGRTSQESGLEDDPEIFLLRH